MAGRPPKVDRIRDDFISAVGSARTLFTQVRKIGTIRPSKNCERLHAEHVRRVMELAFLGMIAAWEEFLERSMVRYLAGAKTKAKYAPSPRIGYAKGLEHAYFVLSGDPEFNREKHYLNWTDPGLVMKLAGVYFEQGRPYSNALTNKESLLQDAVKLRNRVAHSSSKCRQEFKSAARKFLGLTGTGKLRQSYRVGDLLEEKARRHFGTKARDKSWTIFEAYAELYTSLARTIVPA